MVRVGPGTPAGAVETAHAAAAVAGVRLTVSDAATEDDHALAVRLADLGADRLRVLAPLGDALAAAAHAADVAVDTAAVSADGHVELPRWVREQAISTTRHRYGLVRR